MAIYGVYHKIESQGWIKTTATIERTRFREDGVANRTYSVTIFYSYNADGLRHSGSSTSTDHRWQHDARRIANEYSPGKSIAIIYDPKATDRSEVKQPGWRGSFKL